MEVRIKIRDELDRLFAHAPQNRAAWELQEELLANCMERYQDLVDNGMDPTAALNSVMGSIGNVDELIAALPGEDAPRAGTGLAPSDAQRAASAKTVTIAIGLYILAGVVFLLMAASSSFLGRNMAAFGLAMAALICIVPTCMLVYNAQRYPRYNKQNDTVVEEFKQWSHDTDKLKGLRRAISSIIWTLALVLYFVISFATFAWAFTWMIFPIAACAEAVVSLVFRLKEFT